MTRVFIAAASGILFCSCAGEFTPTDRPDQSAPRFDKGIVIVDSRHSDQTKFVPQDGPLPDAFYVGDIGKACEKKDQCQFGLCVVNNDTGQHFCTRECDPCSSMPCPPGYGCQAADSANICAKGYADVPCTQP